MTRMEAIVVAVLVRLADVAAMKLRVARMRMTAIARTYPRIGRIVSIRPICFYAPKCLIRVYMINLKYINFVKKLP